MATRIHRTYYAPIPSFDPVHSRGRPRASQVLGKVLHSLPCPTPSPDCMPLLPRHAHAHLCKPPNAKHYMMPRVLKTNISGAGSSGRWHTPIANLVVTVTDNGWNSENQKTLYPEKEFFKNFLVSYMFLSKIHHFKKSAIFLVLWVKNQTIHKDF